MSDHGLKSCEGCGHVDGTPHARLCPVLKAELAELSKRVEVGRWTQRVKLVDLCRVVAIDVLSGQLDDELERLHAKAGGR